MTSHLGQGLESERVSRRDACLRFSLSHEEVNGHCFIEASQYEAKRFQNPGQCGGLANVSVALGERVAGCSYLGLK